jgi:hypothetical protein
MDLMKLVQRATNISLKPKSEWELIATEPTSTADLYKYYILPLAAIGPVALFIAMSGIGISVPFMGSYRVPVAIGLSTALTQYVQALVSIYLIALVINGLAPTFGGKKNVNQALKLAAYASTPVWLAGALQVLPSLSVIGLLVGLYGLYILYVGIPVMMKAPQDRAVGYTAATVVCVIVLSIAAGALTAAVTGGSLVANTGAFTTGAVSETVAAAAIMAAEAQKAAMAGEGEATAGATMAQAATALAQEANAASSGVQLEPVDQAKLKALLPDALPNLARTSIEAEKSKFGEFAVSMATAVYGKRDEGGPSIEIRITDHGGHPLNGLAVMGFMVTRDRETETEYERSGVLNGHPTHEKGRKDGSSSSYTVAVAKRFLMEIEGDKVDMEAVKRVGDKINIAKLAAMKGNGAKR